MDEYGGGMSEGDMAKQVDEDNCRRGLVVARGPGWEWGDQDGGEGGLGVVLRHFYTQNPYAESGGEGGEEMWGMPAKICLAQVHTRTLSRTHAIYTPTLSLTQYG